MDWLVEVSAVVVEVGDAKDAIVVATVEDWSDAMEVEWFEVNVARQRTDDLSNGEANWWSRWSVHPKSQLLKR